MRLRTTARNNSWAPCLKCGDLRGHFCPHARRLSKASLDQRRTLDADFDELDALYRSLRPVDFTIQHLTRPVPPGSGVRSICLFCLHVSGPDEPLHRLAAPAVFGEEPAGTMPPYVIADYGCLDASLRSADDPYLVSLCGADRFARWQGLDEASEMACRQHWMDALIADVDRAYPGFAGAVNQAEIATARTMKNRLGTPFGEVYGLRLVAGALVPARAQRRHLDRWPLAELRIHGIRRLLGRDAWRIDRSRRFPTYDANTSTGWIGSA